MILEEDTRHLASLGLGRIPDEIAEGDLYYARRPETPDEAGGILPTDASMPGSGQGARLQLIVRARTVRDATLRMQGMLDALDGFEGFLSGSGSYARIRVDNGVHGLGTDDRRRVLYSANLRVWYCGGERG